MPDKRIVPKEFARPQTSVSQSENGCFPASRQEAQTTLAKCVEAMTKLACLEVCSSTLLPYDREMLLVRCQLHEDHESDELIRCRVTDGFKSAVVATDASMHRISDTPTGFDVEFAVISPKGSYITGRIAVESS